MKNFALTCALALGVLLALNSCSTKTTGEQATEPTGDAAGTAAPTPVTVCTWNELNVRETPSEKGKYLTSIYLNEPVTLTGDTASEKSGSKSFKYHKVTLSDGKSGWVRDEFIAIGVFPGAVKSNGTSIYKRPDISTVTEKQFNSGDYVVAKEASPGWFEVTGKPVGEKWFVSGYVQGEHLLLAPIEAQFAALSRRAAEASKPEMAAVLNGQLADESVFSSSTLYQWWVAAQYGEEEEVQNYPMADLWYLFKGNAMDIHGGNAGTVYGAQLVDDPWGNKESSYHFDGGNYIVVPEAVKLQNVAFSVGAMFKPDDMDMHTPEQTLVSQRPFDSNDDTGFVFAFQGGAGNGTVTIGIVGQTPLVLSVPLKKPANANWNYVVATYDGQGLKMYIENELAGEMTISTANAEIIESNLLNTTSPTEIGSQFRGTIDQVFIFNRALTAEDIWALDVQK